jgi:phage portal protein BeeE
MATQTELAGALEALTAKVAKIGLETAANLDRIAALEAERESLLAQLAAAGGTTPVVDSALAALAAQVQLVDDLNPDAPAA